jgi:hypothetical protein
MILVRKSLVRTPTLTLLHLSSVQCCYFQRFSPIFGQKLSFLLKTNVVIYFSGYVCSPFLANFILTITLVPVRIHVDGIVLWFSGQRPLPFRKLLVRFARNFWLWLSVAIHMRVSTRVARFFLVQTYQIGKNVPNDHKRYQTEINYTQWQ